ncbi:Uncharacterized membrane protein YkvA, DUF1232 family [Apibacter mensalis]|uniref:Uncharacterized membrane protein YkvA, DUF1232 family n=1 Tax=Apibacter mensalis TaxID=1586267 RepID=A0A0X3AQ81_9FLAO|nr:YkvA family protein [Apibacter mensalis]CVK16531.1 Uncharacterized membrane protein YkvA, DUF1232 family [Apibacter mensalis]
MKAKHLLGIVSKNKSFISKIPVLFRMLMASLKGQYKPGIKNLFIFTFLIVYILSPLDLIPDFLVGIGFLDDLTIAFFAISKLMKEVDKFLEWEKQNHNTIVIE